VASACSASNGDSALDLLRRSRFDVLVLDLMLPGPNGFEIIRELKSRAPEMLGHTIVLTAVGRTVLRDFSDAKLVHRVIHKPFDLDDFLNEVLSLTSLGVSPGILSQTEEHVH
jgi:DNA-binding response OmpR family regulator